MWGCVYVYTHTHTQTDHSVHLITEVPKHRHKYCTNSCRCTSTNTENTLQYSFLGWMCWHMTLFNTVSSALCLASSNMGHSQVQGGKERETVRGRKTTKRGEVIPCGNITRLEVRRKGKRQRSVGVKKKDEVAAKTTCRREF